MRLTISLTAALAVCAYSNLAQAQSTSDSSPAAQPAPATAPMTEPAAAPTAAPAAVPKPFQLMETTWTYTDEKGRKVQESIDAKGNYIENALDGKHVDHGTAVMKGDKACFTSAMTKDGEMCWTTKPVEIGQSMDTVSDKGQKLKVTRVDYVTMTIPK